MSTFVLEYIQTDPADSPTPGYGHYAGERAFRSSMIARGFGRRAIGSPVPAEHFHPCCSWQRPDTPVTGFRVVELDGDGNETGKEWFR